jgi:hypothetical protein
MIRHCLYRNLGRHLSLLQRVRSATHIHYSLLTKFDFTSKLIFALLRSLLWYFPALPSPHSSIQLCGLQIQSTSKTRRVTASSDARYRSSSFVSSPCIAPAPMFCRRNPLLDFQGLYCVSEEDWSPKRQGLKENTQSHSNSTAD